MHNKRRKKPRNEINIESLSRYYCIQETTKNMVAVDAVTISVTALNADSIDYIAFDSECFTVACPDTHTAHTTVAHTIHINALSNDFLPHSIEHHNQ